MKAVIRKGPWRLGLALLLLAPWMAAEATDEGFARYRVILERKPFGEPPPEPVTPPEPTEEEPPWAKLYRLCSVYQAAGKPIEVALLDLRENKPVMLTLGGAPSQGIELLAADLSNEEATLSKEGRTYTMKLEESKTNPAVQARQQQQQQQTATTTARQQAIERARAVREARAEQLRAMRADQGGDEARAASNQGPRGVLRNRR